MHYHHITIEERVKIETLRNEGYNSNAIAVRLGRHRSTIMRELERNHEGMGNPYRAKRAQRQTQRVRTIANASLQKLSRGTPLTMFIEKKIEQYWSPEQIAGRLKKERKRNKIVCHETIYQYLYHERRDLIPYLRHGHKRRYRRRYGTKLREQRREMMKKRRIDTRPDVIEKRKRVGDWEGDTIVGKEKNIHLLTHVDRKTGFLLLDFLPHATAEQTRTITTQRFKQLPHNKCKSITYDNGVQFAEHEATERDLKTNIYFAYPYHSWERGTNENTNGLVRQFFRKGTPFKHLTNQQIKRAEKLINTRPRKRLNYATPQELF